MTDRNLTAGMVTQVQAAKLQPFLLFEGEFADSAFLRLWTGVGDLSWNGYTWTGGGQLIQISPVGESTNIEALGFTATVSGMPSVNISIALQSLRQGKPGKVWLGVFDQTTGEIVPDPYLVQEGKFDVAVIDDDGDKCTIAASYESRLVELLKPRDRRYTHEDQRLDYLSDKGFQFVPSLQDRVLIWGGPGASSSPVAGVDQTPPSSTKKRVNRDGD